MSLFQEKLETQGYAIAPRILSCDDISNLIAQLDGIHEGKAETSLRLLRDCGGLVDWLIATPIGSLLEGLEICEHDLVRVLFFNKSLDNNWFVPWHQDRTISVREKFDVSGFSNWTMKNEVPHVEPPVRILERMTTFRLHLDENQNGQGNLRVLPGTHRRGRLEKGEIEDVLGCVEPIEIKACAGDVFLMKPLLLHSSLKSKCSRDRRVLQLEYSPDNLPSPLQWHFGQLH